MSEDTSHAQISNKAQSLTLREKELSSTAEPPAGCHCLRRAWENTCCELKGRVSSAAGFSQHCMETRVGQAQLDTAWTMIQERDLLLLLSLR